MKKFKKFNVDYDKYRIFEYRLFAKNGTACARYPTTYKPGDVVYIKPENAVGVVLGWIDEEWQELRTDMSGMVSYQDLELYNPFKHPLDVRMTPTLREELWIKIFKIYLSRD